MAKMNISFTLDGIFSLQKRLSAIVGVDIGSSSVKVISLKLGKKPALASFSIIGIPPDSNDEYITGVIKKALEDKKISCKDAALTFGGDMIAFRRVELPSTMPAAEISEALKWKAKEAIDFNIENAYTASELLREVQGPEGAKTSEFIFVAVQKDDMDKKVEVLKNAGLDVVSVSVHPFGLETILKSAVESETVRTVMAADIGYEKTEMSVFKNKALEFVRSIPIGSNTITEALQAPITTDSGEVKFSVEEAERIKHSIGIAYDAVDLEKGVSSVQALSLMRPPLEQMLKEIRRSIEYYTHEYGSEGAAVALYLAGSGSKLKNLDKYLREELNLSVSRISPENFMDVSGAGAIGDDFVSIAALAGVAIGYGSRLNLLPKKYKMEKLEMAEKIAFRMAAVIIIAALGTSLLFTRLGISDYSARLKSIPFQKDILAGVKELQDRVIEREIFLSKVKNMSLDIELIMKELSNIVPPGIVLSSLRIDSNNKTLDMSGAFHGPRTSAETVLTKFMEDLERSARFKEAQLLSIQGQTGQAGAKEESSSFEINCLLE